MTPGPAVEREGRGWPYETLRKRLFIARVFPLLAAGVVGSAFVAYPSMFSSFGVSDDVGYSLISLKGLIANGHLYDQVYSQWGPFFYEFWGGLFALFGIDPTHDSGGMATLVVWLLVSLLIGFSTYRVTGSALLGLCIQLLTFRGIGILINEPMHPGGLICLLLSVTTVASTFVARRPAGAMLAIGAATAGLALTKLNVGGFALLGVALACAATYPIPSGRRWVRPLIEICAIALPAALMARQFDQAWVRVYAAHATLGIGALVVALRVWRPSQPRPTFELRWLAGGLVGGGAVIVFFALLTGSGPLDLIRGVVLDPLNLPNVFTAPLPLPSQYLGLDVVALLGCLGLAWLSTRESLSRTSVWNVASAGTVVANESMALARALLGLVAGLAVGLTAAGVELPYAGAGGLWPLGLAWISLLPTRAEAKPEMEFARRLIPALAVLQSLHAYPVAASQVGWSSFLLLPVAAISFNNGLRDLADLSTERFHRPFRLATPAVIAVVTVLVANATIRAPLDQARTRYDSYEPLRLAGSSRLRLPTDDVRVYRAVAREIQHRCNSFLSLPGLNSFYLWTEERPPTYLNATDWMFLFDTGTQRRIVDDVRGSRRLCLLRNRLFVAIWAQGRAVPRRPLVRFLSDGFTPLRTIGTYELLIRDPGRTRGR